MSQLRKSSSTVSHLIRVTYNKRLTRKPIGGIELPQLSNAMEVRCALQSRPSVGWFAQVELGWLARTITPNYFSASLKDLLSVKAVSELARSRFCGSNDAVRP